ncbi:hypothetical protein [Sphingobium ummariense]
MATIYVHNSYAEASRSIAFQIARRCGPMASIDDFEVRVFDVPHEGSDRKGKAIVAAPKGQEPGPGNAIIAYWGDAPVGKPAQQL